MSAKQEKEKRLLQLAKDRNKLAGKIIGLKMHCQNNLADKIALHKLCTLISIAEQEMSKNVTL